MDKDDETRRRAPSDGRAADDHSDSGSPARRWQPLRAQLTPLIGENGFGALVGRSVRLVAPEFAFLAMEAPPKTSDQWFAALEQRLSTVEPDVARAADAALMNAFIRQLTGLIGAALTRRLLAAVSDGSDGHDLDRSTGK